MGAPPGVQAQNLDPAPRLSDGSLDVWTIYASITSPQARHYLQLIAQTNYVAVNVAVAQTGLSKAGKVHESWMHNYAGYMEMEQEIRRNPRFAASFLAGLALPSAIVHAAEVLASDAPGVLKSDASKLILNVATSQTANQRRRVTVKDKRDAQKQAEGGVADTKKRFGLVG